MTATAPVTATKPMTATAPVTGTIATTTTVSLEGTQWKMVSYLDSKGQTVQALPDSEVTATFQNGTVVGKDGCNQYAGTYKVTGNVLTVKLGPSTMMACEPQIMTQAQGYLAALGSSATYQITGKQLQITNGGGKVAVTYTVLEPTPLVGTTWQATMYNNGRGAVQSLALGTEITAIFGADGTLSGSAGCNNYSTTYTVVTTTMKISPAIAATRMMCPEPVMQQEAAYLAALPTVATYRIESNKLELRDAKGALQASYTAKLRTGWPSAGSSSRAGGHQDRHDDGCDHGHADLATAGRYALEAGIPAQRQGRRVPAAARHRDHRAVPGRQDHR